MIPSTMENGNKNGINKLLQFSLKGFMKKEVKVSSSNGWSKLKKVFSEMTDDISKSLVLAAKLGDEITIRSFLDDENVNSNHVACTTAGGWSILHEILFRGHVSVASSMLGHEKVELERIGTGLDGYNLLHCAASCDENYIFLPRLVRSGVDLEARTKKYGDTPLHIASFKNNCKVIKVC